MTKVQSKRLFHYIIVALFCFGFRFIPPFAGITPMGMGILGAFIGAVYGWVFIDLGGPTMLAIVGSGLSMGMAPVLAGCFGNETFLIMFAAMLAIGPAIETGAVKWLALKVLNSKALEGRAYLLICVIFLISWLLSSVNALLIAIMVFGVTAEIFKQVGVKKNDKLAIFTYLGIAYQIMRGQILFPFITTGLVYLNAYKTVMPDQPMEIGAYMTMMILMGLIMLAIYMLAMKFIFRVDVSPLSNYRSQESTSAITRDQKISLIFFFAFIVLNFLAVLGPLKGFLGMFGLTGITFTLSCIMTVIPNETGDGVLCDQEKMLHMASLSLALCVGYIMFLARYFVTPDTGIGNAVAMLFQPFISLPPIVFIVVVMVIALIVTNLANNMMVAVVCLPFLVNFTGAIGMAPMAAVALMFIITEFALCTPAGSPITAIAMSQELVDMKTMMKYSVPMVLILFVVFLVVGWPLANFIF